MPVTLEQRVFAAIRDEKWFAAGSRIAVGVSGGADSVALLRLLQELADRLGIVVSVAHLNHKLRGQAADADEKFVRKLADERGLVLYVERVDVAARVKRERTNAEDAARRVRYDFFARLIAENKVDRVAVAHTADDQAETVLAHVLRGTGLAGLGGIHPETEYVVRPLLHVRRAELRTYLRTKRQRWREDATNRDTTRTRARIRKKLLPLLEREFQPAVVEHLVSLAALARNDEALLDAIARERCNILAKEFAGAIRIPIADLLAPWRSKECNTEPRKAADDPEKRSGAHPYDALTKRLLRRLIERRKRGQKKGSAQITAQHIDAVLELARRGENGKELQLPGAVRIRRDRDELVFQRADDPVTEKLQAPGESAPDYECQIDFQNGIAVLALPQAGCAFRLTVIDWPTNRGETIASGTVVDRDRLHGPLVLRNWRPGDRLQPAGHQKTHKLKRLLNEKHVSRWERRGWPVLTSGGKLVWARSFGVAAEFATSQRTVTGISIAEESLDG